MNHGSHLRKSTHRATTNDASRGGDRRTTRPVVAALALGVLFGVAGSGGAWAQAAGNNDRIMTRDELRACMKRSDGLKTGNDDLGGGRKTLDAEKAELAKAQQALDQEVKAVAAERDTVDKTNEAAVKAYNDKATAMIATYNTKKADLDTKVDAWNSRNRAHNERGLAHEQALKSYNDECTSRRFREDDEKAIRAGK